MGEGESGIKDFHPGISSEAEVGEEKVDFLRLENLSGLPEVSSHVAIEGIFERHAEGIAGGLFVVDNEEGFHGKMTLNFDGCTVCEEADPFVGSWNKQGHLGADFFLALHF